MSADPRVTAIIPAYNPGPFLERSLASVLAQENVDLDVVVVDDGSSEDISQVPGLDDPRVRFLRQENRGVSAARNLAVALTDAEYVAFLDQDDEWSSRTKIAQQLDVARDNPDASFVHAGFTWVLPNQEVDASRPSPVTYETSLAGSGYVCLSSLLVQRVRYIVVGGHDIALAQQQDWDLVLKLLKVFGPAAHVSGAMVRYHVHGGNASNNYAKAAQESNEVYDRNIASDRTGTIGPYAASGRRSANRLYASKAIDAARESLRARDLTATARHLVEAGRITPSAVPAALKATASRRLGRGA
ncbi:glycosyltransferase [Kribbia dieselivorans]|uniref:glycosyltransferase n=1 Tax=Kribbia dieselivorans TaxID=331526 RepID=UPI0009F8DCF5|nr:glycosyltransferase [Kribbia dieselivorans]